MTKDRNNLLVQPSFGATFFDGKLSSTLYLGVRKKNNETKLVQDQPELYTELSVFKNDYVSFAPYMDLYTPGANYNPISGSNDTVVLLSGQTIFSAPTLEGSLGKLSSSLLVDPYLGLGNRAETANAVSRIPAENLSDFGLAANSAEGEATTVAVNKQEPDYVLLVSPSVKYVPAIAPKLSLSFRAMPYRTFSPQYEIVESAGEASTEKVGYSAVDAAQNRYTISYDVGNGLTIYNQTRQYFNGQYESRVDGATRWHNRLGITYKMF